MAETQLIVPQGAFTLHRPHTSTGSPLRAWSAADQLVLEALTASDEAPELGQVLIVNDEFGALTTALASHGPTVWTDSALSRLAIEHNLEQNDLDPLPPDRSISGAQVPNAGFDTVIVRVPKTSALLEHQLRAVRSVTTAASRVIGTGMVRHIHRSTTDAFETYLGPTTTSLAKRKARLIHPVVSPDVAASAGEWPSFSEFTTPAGVVVAELPGTFSAGHVDVGTALLLDVLGTISEPDAGATVADLGCGNGVVAATIARRWPDCTFVLLDASDLAVAAARQTWQRNSLASPMSARATDGFGATPDASLDMVVTNPPFHQGHALDRELTDRLLADTARVLTSGGAAYVVVQRHLKLHATMARWFESVQVVSKHPSHVVLEARRPKR